MKLIIQIPCLNEEEALPIALKCLPRELEGFDSVEWLVIDDGSTDNTVEVARTHGVDHVVSLSHNKGLSRAFMAGLEASLKRGADVIVNTDADNQYDARDIPNLVRPILEDRAQIVVGARPIDAIDDFSTLKKILQKIGSWVVRLVSATDVPDATSGFRAITKEAAIQLNVFNPYTYTLETLIQAGRKNIAVISVPIRINPKIRESRLIKSVIGYIIKSIITIVRIFVIYKPFRLFSFMALVLFIPGFLGYMRFLLDYFAGAGAGKLQSLIISTAFITTAGIFQMGAFLADIMAANRSILEDVRTRLLTAEIDRFKR